MSDTTGKTKVSNFKKRPHRPWKSDLLETTVQEAAELGSDSSEYLELDLGTNEIDLELGASDELNIDLSPDLQNSFSQLESIALSNESNSVLKNAIKNSEQQKSQLIQQIGDRSSSSILLGGFFQPQQLSNTAETQSTRKMNYLLSDLKSREQELNSLNSNLKVTEALEKAEQAELNRRAEEHRRLAAEHRMRQAIEQAQVAAEQCRMAMEQANQAALGHRDAEQQRHIAEDQIKDFQLRITNAEMALQNERAAKIAAEAAAQQAILQAQDALQKNLHLQGVENIKNTEEARRIELEQQLEHLKKSEEARRLELEYQLETQSKKLMKLEIDNREYESKTFNIETKFKEDHALLIAAQQKVTELTAQIQKLKNIIEAEQQLRKVAEQRATEALTRAEAAEKQRDHEIEQRKLIDERAKRAVEHASRTVMHLLNAPVDKEYNMRLSDPAAPKEKLKIRMPAVTTTPTEDDDYSF